MGGRKWERVGRTYPLPPSPVTAPKAGQFMRVRRPVTCHASFVAVAQTMPEVTACTFKNGLGYEIMPVPVQSPSCDLYTHKRIEVTTLLL